MKNIAEQKSKLFLMLQDSEKETYLSNTLNNNIGFECKMDSCDIYYAKIEYA